MNGASFRTAAAGGYSRRPRPASPPPRSGTPRPTRAVGSWGRPPGRDHRDRQIDVPGELLALVRAFGGQAQMAGVESVLLQDGLRLAIGGGNRAGMAGHREVDLPDGGVLVDAELEHRVPLLVAGRRGARRPLP